MSTNSNFQFSVLMPVYHKESPVYLETALNSILVDQTIKPTEVVIIEDGGLTAQLDEVLNKFLKEYAQIVKLFKLKDNMGMGYAMNYGLNKCSNEWIFRMDSDDIAIPTRFEEQIKTIQSGNYDVVGGSINEFNETVGDINQLRIMPENHTDIIKFMKFRNPINHMAVAFRRNKALQAGGYWEKRYFEDYNLWYEMYKVDAMFYNIPKVLVNARIGNNMVERRRGYAYHKYESELLNKMLEERFVNFFEHKMFISGRFILRIVPVGVLKFVYQRFLRKNK